MKRARAHAGSFLLPYGRVRIYFSPITAGVSMFWRRKKTATGHTLVKQAAENEAEKVVQVSVLCAAVIDQARLISHWPVGHEGSTALRERLEQHKAAAIEIIEEMTEDVYRSAAYQTLIALCMTAGDVEDAQRLSLKVKDAAVKERLLAIYPQLAS